MNLASYLGLLDEAEQTLATAYRQTADRHADEPDVHQLCRMLAGQCDDHQRELRGIAQTYGKRPDHEAERLHSQSIVERREGPLGLLRDMQDLYLLASFVDITWTMVKQAGLALRDRELLDVVARCASQTATHLKWLETRMKQSAPQALIAADR